VGENETGCKAGFMDNPMESSRLVWQ